MRQIFFASMFALTEVRKNVYTESVPPHVPWRRLRAYCVGTLTVTAQINPNPDDAIEFAKENVTV